MFIDSHAHLDDEQFNEDRNIVIDGLKDNQISLVVNIGADLESSLFSKKLAQQYDNIYFAAGIHPHDAKAATEDILNEITKLLNHSKCVALGEIGLDYFKNYSPHDIQRSVFEKQLIIAKKKTMPIVVHMREATKDTVGLLKKYYPAENAGVIHSFSGSIETAKIMLDMGFYLSISGPVTYKDANNLKKVAKYIPLDRLLIETDSPYLSPVPCRGKRNEPQYIKYTAMQIAQLKEIDVEEIAKVTAQNACVLFGLTKP
jgi:TatD DNase family protein